MAQDWGEKSYFFFIKLFEAKSSLPSHQSLNKRNIFYSTTELSLLFNYVCYERSDGNMKKRAYRDVPAVFLATESSFLHCF